jgi:hypothetical protein
MEIYNAYKLNGVNELGAIDSLEEGKKPSDCISCAPVQVIVRKHSHS